jgi:glycosyltransferase involved in cell wall biosynthesis
MKVDLVMWTKNGSATLNQVLERINRVVPEEVVNQRFIVDDGSIDNTCPIAASCGWKVYKNKGTGISDGANTALDHVSTEYFCSFEQDVLLSSDWWNKIPRLLKGNVYVASGIRVSLKPQFLYKLQLYSAVSKLNKNSFFGIAYSARARFAYGKTFDNTIYDAAFLRRIGGFPKLRTNLSIDTALAYRMKNVGAVWALDFSVVSDHLRQNFVQELRKHYWHGTCSKAVRTLLGNRVDSFLRIFIRTMLSPAEAWYISYTTESLPIIAYYPLQRFAFLVGMMKSYSDLLHRT